MCKDMSAGTDDAFTILIDSDDQQDMYLLLHCHHSSVLKYGLNTKLWQRRLVTQLSDL